MTKSLEEITNKKVRNLDCLKSISMESKFSTFQLLIILKIERFPLPGKQKLDFFSCSIRVSLCLHILECDQK